MAAARSSIETTKAPMEAAMKGAELPVQSMEAMKKMEPAKLAEEITGSAMEAAEIIGARSAMEGIKTIEATRLAIQAAVQAMKTAMEAARLAIQAVESAMEAVQVQHLQQWKKWNILQQWEQWKQKRTRLKKPVPKAFNGYGRSHHDG